MTRLLKVTSVDQAIHLIDPKSSESNSVVFRRNTLSTPGEKKICSDHILFMAPVSLLCQEDREEFLDPKMLVIFVVKKVPL